MILSIILLSIVICESARILGVFPIPLISHQIVFRQLTHELARRGHEVVVITPLPAFPRNQTPENLTEIDLHSVSMRNFLGFNKITTTNRMDIYAQRKLSYEIGLSLFEKQLMSDEVQRVIKTMKFDLILLEAIVRPSLVFAHIYNVPVIQISSFGGVHGSFEAMGASVHPLLYPLSTRQRIFNLSVWEKIRGLYAHYWFDRHNYRHEAIEIDVLRKYYPNMPNLTELSRNVVMQLLNMYWIFDANRPVPPNVVYIGGIHLQPEKPLPEDLKLYLDNSSHGVIYVSFGTSCSSSELPEEKIRMFINVFKRLPYDILLKWDSDVLPGRSMNIKTAKWFPQPDILRHPRVKLFITQGGLQSTDEAITAGVPLIGIPLYGDQWYNTEQYEKYGIGLKFDIDTLTEDQMYNAIMTMIDDGSYRRRIENLRSLLHDQPQKPLDRAMWWIEHVLRHGGSHLGSPAAHMSWTEYYEVEFILTLFFGLCINIYVLFVLVTHNK